MPQSDLTHEIHWERHRMEAASSQERTGGGGRLCVVFGGLGQSFPRWLGIGSILWPDLGLLFSAEQSLDADPYGP